MKIHPVGAEFFHENSWTDRHDKAKSCFLQFSEQVLNTETQILFSSLNSIDFHIWPIVKTEQFHYHSFYDYRDLPIFKLL